MDERLGPLSESCDEMQRIILHKPREKGAIAIIVAILFGFGVLTGAAALTLDVGNINADRRQLQNGADAVALAVAQQCALTGTCPSPNDPALKPLASANAADAFTKIRRVDGDTPVGLPLIAGLPTQAICGQGGGLSACQPSWTLSTGNLQECPGGALSAKYARVYTETENSAGGTILPYSFGAAIAGAPTGADQQACATVGWGNGKKTGPVLPIAMSYCAWKAATGADPRSTPPIEATYVGAPDYSHGVAYGYDAVAGNLTPDWPTQTENEIYTAASNSTPSGCTTWNGNAAPGNFSALSQSPANSCSTTASDWMAGDTGNDSPCTDAQLLTYRGKLVLIPLFDCVASSTATVTLATNCMAGGNAFYRITGYATFYLTGWQFSGTSSPYDKSIKDGHQLCHGAGTTGNSGRCLSGWFTREMIGAGQIDDSGAPDFGTHVIQVLE